MQKKVKFCRCVVCHHIIVENDAYFQWIESVLEEKIPTKDFEVVLKDGTILCRLMNKIQPGSIKKFRETVILSFHLINSFVLV